MSQSCVDMEKARDNTKVLSHSASANNVHCPKAHSKCPSMHPSVMHGELSCFKPHRRNGIRFTAPSDEHEVFS